MTRVDRIIMGAGTAGLSVLREMRRHTEDFLLVNDGHWGTTCAGNGGMPSKELIEAANAFHRRHAMDSFGIRGTDSLRVDIPAVLAQPPSVIQDRRIVSAEVDFSGVGRARINARAEGVLRIHDEVSHGRILGAEMCVPATEHLTHLLAPAIKRGLSVSEMLAVPFDHPALEEGLRGALRHLQRDLTVKAGSDLSGCERIGHDALD